MTSICVVPTPNRQIPSRRRENTLIPITRRLVKTLRSVFRAALGLSSRAQGPLLHLKSGSDGLFISAATPDAGIRYHLDGAFPDRDFWLPFAFLAQTEGHRNDAVLIDPTSDGVQVQWVVDNVPQTRTFPIDDVPEPVEPPQVEFTENPSQLLVALAEASRTCDPDSRRYALNCLQLRGETGEVVATDSHQLMISSGFSFPWEDNVLVPGSRLFAHRALRTDKGIGVGRADDVIALRIGPWTTWMSIEQERRFPETDSVIPNIEGALASVHVPREDGEFLARAVGQLPANKRLFSPVTVDLNGSVAIRARSDDGETLTELVLSRSERTGEPIRFCTNRTMLARAMRLGFDRLHVFGPQEPVVCTDGSRKYVWMLLNKEGVIKPSPEATRIESTSTTHHHANPTPRQERNLPAMQRTDPRQKSERTNGAAPADNLSSLIKRAESVRDSLQSALTDVRELITALKQQRKNSRTMQTALKSLRQLERLEV